MKITTKLLTVLAGVLLVSSHAPTVFAQTAASGAGAYPNKTIRFIVGFAPGGSTDIVARLIGQQLGKNVGQQVLVDNRTGAGGIIAAEVLAKSPPDGYTIFACTTGTFAIQPFMYSKLPYNVEKDIVPVTQTGSLPYIIVVHPSLPVSVGMAQATRAGQLLSGQPRQIESNGPQQTQGCSIAPFDHRRLLCTGRVVRLS